MILDSERRGQWTGENMGEGLVGGGREVQWQKSVVLCRLGSKECIINSIIIYVELSVVQTSFFNYYLMVQTKNLWLYFNLLEMEIITPREWTVDLFSPGYSMWPFRFLIVINCQFSQKSLEIISTSFLKSFTKDCPS